MHMHGHGTAASCQAYTCHWGIRRSYRGHPFRPATNSPSAFLPWTLCHRQWQPPASKSQFPCATTVHAPMCCSVGSAIAPQHGATHGQSQRVRIFPPGVPSRIMHPIATLKLRSGRSNVPRSQSSPPLRNGRKSSQQRVAFCIVDMSTWRCLQARMTALRGLVGGHHTSQAVLATGILIWIAIASPAARNDPCLVPVTGQASNTPERFQQTESPPHLGIATP